MGMTVGGNRGGKGGQPDRVGSLGCHMIAWRKSIADFHLIGVADAHLHPAPLERLATALEIDDRLAGLILVRPPWEQPTRFAGDWFPPADRRTSRRARFRRGWEPRSGSARCACQDRR